MTNKKEKIMEAEIEDEKGETGVDSNDLMNIKCGSCKLIFTVDSDDIDFTNIFYCLYCGVELEIKIDAETLVQKIKDEYHGDCDEDKLEEMVDRLGELAKKGEEK
jgi:hypothetical protein